MSKYKVCQSCGMPLSSDGKNNGTEANGTICLKYCNFCYYKGKFVFSNISVREMKELIVQNTKYPRVMKWFYMSKIGKLERWNQNLDQNKVLSTS
ncbi:MAG: zinc ribbon domain-containing protein [bacterium]